MPPTASPPPLRGRRRASAPARAVAALALVGLVLLPLLSVPAAAAGEAPTIEARAMLQGHARVGTWMAIDVRLRNEGPAVVGELRLGAGAQGLTRFSTPVELGTPSDQIYRLYAQPPAIGGQLEVALVGSDGKTIVRASVPFRPHDPGQLVVGIVAERPQGIVANLDLLPNPNGAQPVVVLLGPDDLPDRVEAWATLDHLVWQDVDAGRLEGEQIAALRGWLAAGGRLVLAGGTAGPAALAAFPDDILPYRPTATVDAPASALGGLLGQLPADAADVPALAGELARGRTLSAVGERAVAAETAYGNGTVTVLGFDPGAGWIGEAAGTEALWRRLLPARTTSATVGADDSQIVQAVTQLPSLALPPTGGLLALLLGYIALIGPVNYVVLRRLDRREWAWITMPVLIVVFAAGAYAYGAALRGLDVIVNEVAIVRGAPGATEGTAQVYLGIFSPSRRTYQLEVPAGALLASTVSGELGAPGALDIVQGQPSRVRNLAVGFQRLRTLRAETPASVPRISADLRLVGGRLEGSIHNLSDRTLERPAVVLGTSVAVLDDLAPGATAEVSVAIRSQPFGASLADKILGQIFFGDPTRTNERTQRMIARHGVLSQLALDPQSGMTTQLPSESPVLLAWGADEILDVRIEGQVPRRTGNVLYYVPLPMAISGETAFDGDLIRNSVVEVDAPFFGRDPHSVNFGPGTVTLAYRPIAFEGTLDTDRLLLAVNFGDGSGLGGRRAVPVEPVPPVEAPVPAQPDGCNPDTGECFDGIPEVELLDTVDGSWLRVPRLKVGTVYEVADPARYVEAATGTVLVRFVNERQEHMSVQFQMRIEGSVR